MSDQKFDSLPEPLPESQPHPSAMPDALDQPDIIRSAFGQQEDTPRIEEESSSGIGNFFRDLTDKLKNVLGLGREKTEEESTFQIFDADLLPIDEKDSVEEDPEFEAGFAFIEQERLETKQQEESPRIRNINTFEESPPDATQQESGAGTSPEEALPSIQEPEETLDQQILSEEELRFQTFLPETGPFPSTNENPAPEQPAFKRMPEDQENDLPFTVSPDSPPDEDPFRRNEESTQGKGFSDEDLKTFLRELDAKEAETIPHPPTESFEAQSPEDWNIPFSPSPAPTRILGEESGRVESEEEDDILNLRSMFNEEDMTGNEEGEDTFAPVRPQTWDNDTDSFADLDPSLPEDTPSDGESSFDLTEEEIEALNPEDFLPESILKDSKNRVFILEEDQPKDKKPTPGEPETELRDEKQTAEPFSRSTETESYFNNLRSVLKTDEDDRSKSHASLVNHEDLASVGPKKEKDSIPEKSGNPAALDNSKLFTKLDKGYEDAPQLFHNESQKPKSILAEILTTFSKWDIKEELMVGAAVLFGLLVFSTITIFAINSIFLPFIHSIQLPDSASALQNAAVEEVDPSIYPVSLKLPGGWVFPLQESTFRDGNWNPVAAEYLQDATIRRVIAIPWSEQTEAVISTFEKGDELVLFMNNNDIKGYKVEEVKTVSQEDTSILVDTHPSLVVILSNPEASTRWVVICKP